MKPDKVVVLSAELEHNMRIAMTRRGPRPEPGMPWSVIGFQGRRWYHVRELGGGWWLIRVGRSRKSKRFDGMVRAPKRWERVWKVRGWEAAVQAVVEDFESHYGLGPNPFRHALIRIVPSIDAQNLVTVMAQNSNSATPGRGLA